MAKGKKTGGGNRKGIPNKTTSETKDVLLACIKGQTDYFDETMEKIRFKNPERWSEIMVKLFGFIMPSRLDVTSAGEAVKTFILELSEVTTKADGSLPKGS